MIYRFGDCVLDVEQHKLRRGDAVVTAEPKVFEVLRYLLEHRGRVVSRHELLAQCWSETYVSDAALNRCLSRVRQAIGQTRTSPQVIRTVHGAGYRFMVEVTELAQASAVERETPATVLKPLPLAPQPSPLVEQGPSLAAAPTIVGPPAPHSQASLPATPAVQHTPQAERRQLTVFSCTLAEADALVAHLDPEDFYDMMQTFRSACLAIIEQYEGYVAQQVDDGFLVYFGYPQAHEDDAHRAIRTGVQLVETLRRRAHAMASLPGAGLAARVGIHTGLMIAELGSQTEPPLAVGVVPRIAAGLRDLARPHTVVISAATAQLIEGYFICKPLGDQTLSGQPEPLAVYEVQSESTLRTRLAVGMARGLTPFVGREAEVALLHERWAQAQEGMGQVVVLSGDAGIGKSRLVQELKDSVAETPHIHLECRCSSYHQNTAMYPLVDLLQQSLHWQSEDSVADKLDKLEELLGQYGQPLNETVPLLAGLLSLRVPEDRYPPLTMPPQRQRQQTLEALLALLLSQTAAHPVVFIVEDLHWVDPSTLEFLDLVVGQVPTMSIMVMLTCRPTFEPLWDQRMYVTPLALTRLSRPQMGHMITQVAGGKTLPQEVVQQLMEKTDGVPLFVEELTYMVLESGQLRETEGRYELSAAQAQLAIPATLQDSLMARLDRLGMGKELAQWGAALGREFTYTALAAVAPFEEVTLQHGLRQLVEAEVVFQRGLLPQAHYRFKHALIQDAAYESILKRRRQEMHQQIAQVLAEQFADVVETHPELLARHLTEAGLSEQALRQWQKAGEQEITRSAYVEAIAHLTKGLEVLLILPNTPERAQCELHLQLTLGPALSVTKGSTSPEYERTYVRARELCHHVGDTSQLFSALWGLWRFHHARAELQTARELGEQCLDLAERQSDAVILLRAHYVLGTTIFYMGDLSLAHTHHECVIGLYNPQQHHVLAARHGEDPGVMSLSYASFTLWLLGYLDQALQRGHQALTLAQELDHPYSRTYALHMAARLHQLRREGDMARERAEEEIALASALGTPQLVAWGTILRGWALATQGQEAEGMAQMRQGLSARRARGMELTRPSYLPLLAEVYGNQGQAEKGLVVLAEALSLVDKNGERFYEAELYRLKGKLLLALSAENHTEAETCFRQALDIARHQQAKSLELRAAMSLAWLWQQQGKCGDARNLLAPVYDWFTEGFDTADLQEAKALLEELM